jgi:hypothetical protein
MDAADDYRGSNHAYDVTAEFIIMFSEIFLPTFVDDLYINIADFRPDIIDGPDEDRYFHPTHLQVAVRIINKISVTFRLAIERSPKVGDKSFKLTLYAMSKQLNKNRRLASIQILAMYGSLTNDLVDMFLTAAWEQPQSIQILAYENIMHIERADSRDIIEKLIETVKNDGSLQRRYVAAMLLVQLARHDQVSVREVQRVLADVINDLNLDLDNVLVPCIFGRDVSNGEDRFDRAMRSLFMKLSFVLDKEKHSFSVKSCLALGKFDLDQEFKDAKEAAEYASCVLKSCEK